MTPNLISKKAYPGITLAETLVALGLLGIVMIPVLFASSAFFTSKLVGVRQKVGVAHDASVFLNRFMDEMYYTNRLLPDSTSTELHYTYMDPTSQAVSNRGYLLKAAADGSGDKVLARLTYNGTNWSTQTNPYGAVDPEQIHLPSTASFSYCGESTCSPTVSPEKAVFVRLSNWQFTPKGGGYTLDMPTSLDVYLSAGASAGGVMLSDTPRALYSFVGTDAFGAGVDLKQVFLNGSGTQLKYMSKVSNGGVLSILVSGQDLGHWHYTASADDGRVYFSTKSGRLLTWKDSVGLSTILSSTTNLGIDVGASTDDLTPMMVVAGDGTLMQGRKNSLGSIWTWKDGVLTTVLSGVGESVGISAMAVDGTGRFYMGESRAYDDSRNNLWTWQAGTGLSSLVSFVNRGQAGYTSMAILNGGGFVFGEHSSAANNSKVTKWTNTGGNGTAQTLLSGKRSMGRLSTFVASNDRVFFGNENSTGSGMWTWKSDTGLATVRPTTDTGTTYVGQASTVGTPDGAWLFFGQKASPADGNGQGRFWAWKQATSTLTELVSGMTLPGYRSTAASSDGRVFFCEQKASAASCWTWKESTGLSVLGSSFKNPGGNYSIKYVEGAQRLFFAESYEPGGQVYTWSETDGLSLILGGLSLGTGERLIATHTDGRVYFGNGRLSPNGEFYTWHKDTGLSTLVSSMGNYPGEQGALTVSATGRVFFGEIDNPGKFYTWKPGTPSGQVNSFTTTGVKTGQNLVVTFARDPYYACTNQDAGGSLYFVDTISKSMDRYIYTGSGYSLTNSLDWSANATTVGAMSVDNTSNAIALLDQGNKQIDVYSNRLLSGAATPASSISLSATTTPTGLAYSNRSGNYLVLDSALQSGTSVRLFVYNSVGTQQTSLGSPISINVTAANLGVSATTETNFKISYDDRKNILYLTAPTVGRVYALTLPSRL